MGVAVFSFQVFSAAQMGTPGPANMALLATGARVGLPFVAGGLLACQLILHPLWCWGGRKLATVVAGKPQERALMAFLALLTVFSVLSVLGMGDQA